VRSAIHWERCPDTLDLIESMCMPDLYDLLQQQAEQEAKQSNTYIPLLPPNLTALYKKLVNSNCSEAILLQYISYPNPLIRKAIALNTRCPSHLLRTLIEDPVKDVKIAAINNPNCPAFRLRLLSADPDPDIRSAVAKHPNSTLLILQKLINDSDASVRTAVKKNVHCAVEWWTH